MTPRPIDGETALYLTDRVEDLEPTRIAFMDAAPEDPFKIRLQIVGGGTARVGEDGAVIVTPNATVTKPSPAKVASPAPAPHKRPVFAGMVDVAAGKQLNADRTNPRAAMTAKLHSQRVQQQAALADMNRRNRERWAPK